MGLTILVEFPDDPRLISQQAVDQYCNQPGYDGFNNDGSVFDFFKTQSDGKLLYYNVVTPYIMAPHPKSYYNDISKGSGTAGKLLLNDVVQELIADGFDFSPCTTNSSGNLHAINMFFAGRNSGVWAKGLWPHKSGLSPAVSLGNGMYGKSYQMSNMGTALRLGTFCHETGHLLCGFPDVYDYDGDSRGNGRYSLMSSSGKPTHPGSVGAYLRYHAGWAELTQIETNSHYRGSVRVDAGSLYQYLNPVDSSEYFMVENRAKIGWEAKSFLPDQGLLIMHCDEMGNHNNQDMSETRHYETSVEQADGLFQIENNQSSGGTRDLFHYGDQDNFDDFTLPNAHWWKNADSNDMASGEASGLTIHSISDWGETMTFIAGSGALTNDPIVGVDRTLLESRTAYGSSPPPDPFAVWNQGGGTLAYSITSLTDWAVCSPASGTATTESDVIAITYDTTALGDGTHLGQINIVNDNDPSDIRIVDIQLIVEEVPLLDVSMDSLVATGVVGRIVEAGCVNIRNNGGGSLEYSFNVPDWVLPAYLTNAVAQEVDCPLIEFSAATLAAGTYANSIEVYSIEDPSSSFMVPVSFHVEDFVLEGRLAANYTNNETVKIGWGMNQALFDSMDIELWHEGVFQESIVAGTENDDVYNWTIPLGMLSGTNYTIRISGAGSSTYKETAPFSIWIHYESFENGFENWVNSTNDTANWKTISGPTSTSSTGPSGASDGISYAYTKAKRNNNEFASLTNHFELYSYSEVLLEFDYHMYGSHIGSLHVDVFDGENWNEDVFSVAGQQHDAMASAWTMASVDLSPWCINNTISIRFRSKIISGNKGDIAIDNVHIWNKENAVGYTLEIASAHGESSPRIGSNLFEQDTVVTSSVDQVVDHGQTQYVCKGWEMTGQNPAMGSTNIAIFALTNNALLTWNWDTNYYLTTAAVHGFVDTASQWVPLGEVVSIEATSEPYYHFDHWSGTVSGSNNPVEITMNKSQFITANFAENRVIKNVPEWWLAAHGLDVSDAAALADTDRDGQLNWEEYYAGTSVTNPASVFALTAPGSVPNGLVVRWNAVSGKTYSVLYKEALSDSAWSTNASGILGVEPESTHTILTEKEAGFIQVLLEE